VVARERAVFAEQARASGKPESIIEKMVDGRMRKYYAEVVLLEQAFVHEPDITVGAAVKKAEAEVGAPISVEGFRILKVGEGVEKADSDFAAEVAAAAKG
jgi:elongation factor Ts